MSENLKNPTKNTQKEPSDAFLESRLRTQEARNALLFQTPSILHTHMGMLNTSAQFEAVSDGSSFLASGPGLLEQHSKGIGDYTPGSAVADQHSERREV
jgi:hypothetical protein